MATVLIDTKPWDKLVAQVKAIGNRQVAVGVFGDAELADIARFHEYGTQTIPERSYLRSTLHEKNSAINGFMRRLGAAYLKGGLPDVIQLLGLLGEFSASQVKAKIRSGIPPALALATIKAKKGKSTPLIDTGRLLNSIRWQIVT